MKYGVVKIYDQVLTSARMEYDAAKEALTMLIVRAERAGGSDMLDAAYPRMESAQAAQDKAAIDLVARVG